MELFRAAPWPSTRMRSTRRYSGTTVAECRRKTVTMNKTLFASDLRPYYPEFMILLGTVRATAPPKVLKEIGEAVRRLSQGTYGYCEECDGMIPIERLRRI